MNADLPTVYLARHGQTKWSVTGQHTGVTDLPLTAEGERKARQLGERLQGLEVAAVFTSPLQRARRTAELAGFGGRAIIDVDLAEWDYGDYEGRRTTDIRKELPDWDLFRDGTPGGETAAQVGARVDRMIEQLRAIDGDALVFAHFHLLCVLAVRWVGLRAEEGHIFSLGEASIGRLSYNHSLNDPVIESWNTYLAA